MQRQSSEGGGPACSMAVLLLIGPPPIISLEQVANIEMFFSSPPLHSVLTSRCPDARQAKGHCCYRSSRVFSLDTLNWREKKLEIQLAATRLCVPTFTVRGYLDFNTVTVIFYWDENIVFLRLWWHQTYESHLAGSSRLLICMGIRPLHKYCATLHAKLDTLLLNSHWFTLHFTAC